MELEHSLHMHDDTGTYAAFLSAAAQGSEYTFREEPPFGSPTLTTTAACGCVTNALASPTMASQFVGIHGISNEAKDTVSVPITFWRDIHFSGQAKGVSVRTTSSIRILVYSGESSYSELIDSPPIITWLVPCAIAGITILPATIDDRPTILLDEELSPEDREARKKGLVLVARIEQLMQTEEGFRDWFQEGFDEIASGHFVTLSEEGWKEE